MPPDPLTNSCLLPGSHLRRSHTIPGGGQGKWVLWQFCPTTKESSLKNALAMTVYIENMDLKIVSTDSAVFSKRRVFRGHDHTNTQSALKFT
jgi:hypothetical protein